MNTSSSLSLGAERASTGDILEHGISSGRRNSCESARVSWYGLSLLYEDQVVKEVDRERRGLVDGVDDGALTHHEQVLLEGGGAVQVRGGFVEEDQLGTVQQLSGDTEPLVFAFGDALTYGVLPMFVSWQLSMPISSIISATLLSLASCFISIGMRSNEAHL